MKTPCKYNKPSNPSFLEYMDSRFYQHHMGSKCLLFGSLE